MSLEHNTKGFLALFDDNVYFHIGGDVYVAKKDSSPAADGYLEAARHFCKLWEWKRREEENSFPFGGQLALDINAAV
jgi:hypothetical protein